MSEATVPEFVLDETDLREIDHRILAMLKEGRVTPNYVRRRLREEGDDYSRTYVQERIARLAEHGHLENKLDSGLYELVVDPREDVERS